MPGRDSVGRVTSYSGIALDHTDSVGQQELLDRLSGVIGATDDAVIIPIVNRGPNGLSAARLTVQRGSTEQVIATPPNRMIIFEGARIRHKVTPIAAGEKRVVWSMTYCANPRNSILQGLARRVKDTAFFGLRALWT